jgi:myo-inositol-1(or 4)-monophosphatase
LDILSKLFPDYVVIGEESCKETYGHEKAIFVDPIDGTTNFIHGIPHLAVSVGIWEKDRPSAGVVYNPILDELFWAAAGKGAYFGNSPKKTGSTDKLRRALIATGFPYTKTDRGRDYEWVTNAFSRLLPDIQDFRRLGSAALDLCYLANGSFDGFYEIGLKPWDVAAAILIVQEAGGVVSNLDGGAYLPGNKGIVAGSKKIHSQLLKMLPSYTKESD